MGDDIITEEETEQQDDFSMANNIDPKEVFDSVKIEETKNEEDEPGTDDVRKMEDEKPVSKENKDTTETEALYAEFGSFLENKADIIADVGVKRVIPTGIKILDAALGGGFPVGALSIVVGQPGSGKSMIAIQSMGAGQLQYPGLIAAFLDSEEATTSIRLSNLGVRYPKIKPYTDITVEKVFKFLEGVCLFKEQKKLMDIPTVIIWDSIANTLSQKEREAEDVNQVIGYKARLLSILIPKYVAKLAQYNISLIAVNQLRDTISIGNFAAPKQFKFMSAGKQMPGGNILAFNAFTLLEMKTKDVILKEKYGFDGIKVAVKSVKNKLFAPNVEITVLGDFVKGFSDFWTSWDFLRDTKRLKTGAWNYLVNLPEQKLRTKDAETLYHSDDKFKEAWDEAVADAIKIDIEEKYNPDLESEENNNQ